MACFVSFRFGNKSQKDKDQIEVGRLKKAHWGEWHFKRAMWPFLFFIVPLVQFGSSSPWCILDVFVGAHFGFLQILLEMRRSTALRWCD